MGTIMTGKELAAIIQSDNQKKAKQLIENGKTPTIAFVRVGDKSDAVAYQKSAIKAMTNNHIHYETFEFEETISEDVFLKKFDAINRLHRIHGILLLRPLPKQLDYKKISQHIDPMKDLDGMSPVNLGKSVAPKKDDFVPITPVAVMKLIEYYDIDLKGKDVVVIGNSLVVGRPLALLLLNVGATVTVCHLNTKDVAAHTRQADIVISATGEKWLVKSSVIKKGAVVVDVGTIYEADGSVYGDVKFDEVKSKASFINPVPGGIGVLTNQILCERLLYAAETSRNSPSEPER